MADKQQISEETWLDRVGISRDPEQELPHINETFRKSKRNVLFWSMVTFLLSIGQVTRGNNIEVTGFIRNFTFDQTVLVALSLLVLIFMAIGFWRAARDLSARNSQFSFGNVYRQTASYADQLSATLRLTSEKLIEGQALASRVEQKLKPQAERVIEIFTEKIEKLKSKEIDLSVKLDEANREIREFTGRITKHLAHADADVWMETRRTIAEDALKTADKLANTRMYLGRNGFERIPDEAKGLAIELQQLDEPLRAGTNIDVPEVDQAELLETLDIIARHMRTIDGSLRGEQEYWISLYDFGAVILAIAGAATVAIWRLAYGNELDILLGIAPAIG